MTAAITGLGVVTALGVGCESFDEALRTGRCGVEECRSPVSTQWAPLPDYEPLLDTAGPEAVREAVLRMRRVGRNASPGLRGALTAALEAWLQAGLEDEDGVGLIVGGSNLSMVASGEAFARAASGRSVRPSYAAHFLDSDHVGAISEVLALRGEGYTIGGASASGGVAIAHGLRAIASGDVSGILVVGAPQILSEAELLALASLGALYSGDPREHACRPFDAEAQGFVYGQGAAAMFLEPVEKAGSRALALLRGASMGLDGNRSTEPSSDGEEKVMRKALLQARIAVEDIDLVSAHGSSSVVGDATEAAALKAVFADTGPWINATKALTGHCLSAAGVVEGVAAVLQLRGGYVHANPALENPIESSLSWAGPRSFPCTLRAVLSNSFGFGGINSSQVFSLAEA